MVEHFDEGYDPLKEYFIEKIQAISVDRRMQALREKVTVNDLTEVHQIRQIASVTQLKVLRTKQFMYNDKMNKIKEETADEKKVEQTVETFKEQFTTNQDIISSVLDKQKKVVLERVMHRRCQSFSRTLRDV